MPELPEVESIRRSIEPLLVGGRVVHVDVRRYDVIEGALPGSTKELLAGDTISSLTRLGKQLAIVGASGRVMVVQLGMSGQLYVQEATPPGTHIHCVWTIQRKGKSSFLVFRDPRRFGGITCIASVEELKRTKWSELGPDALTIKGTDLADKIRTTTRAIKAALLDQRTLAGVGNIYADEALFAASVHPRRTGRSCTETELNRLAAEIRRVLRESVAARGTTLKDYRDGVGELGENQRRLLVYGRAGAACTRCGAELRSCIVSQRTTVYCAQCQPLKKRKG